MSATGAETRAGSAAGAGPAADPADRRVGTRLGPWVLERLLGRGGMGSVYEARAADGAGAGRRVALKVLGDALAQDPAFQRRFEREAKVLATLSHPHVVEVLDQGASDGQLWFAMEYVRGETLRRRLERGALAPREAARIAGEIAEALAYAHGRGVVHRDLKPENVLLDEHGRVRLADFGLLRLARESTPEATTRLTRTDVILGTYEYMAPEQRRGQRDVDGRADVFALGVMLYECLTGRLPLGRFTAATELVRGLPRGVDGVIHHALAPEPRERLASARDFADALRAAMAGAPASAAPAAATTERIEDDLPTAHPAPAPIDPDERARVLNHVEVLAVLDKVAGILLIVVGALLTPFLLGVPLLVGGILLLKLSRRLREHRPGAREAQIAASVLLLFLFPLGTALGVYGLIVVAPTRTRRVLEQERDARQGAGPRARRQGPPPPPVGYVSDARPLRRVEVLVPEPHAGPGLLPRLLLLGAVIWTVFLGVAGVASLRTGLGVPAAVTTATGPEADPRAEAARVRIAWEVQAAERAHQLQLRQDALLVTGAGLLLAGFMTVRRHQQRRRRRGFGLALGASVLLLIDLAFLASVLHLA